jgi:predicted RNA binding protein YcfA (HicA-like mRNA interferase family)
VLDRGVRGMGCLSSSFIRQVRLTDADATSRLQEVTAREVRQILKRAGGVEVRWGKGSHLIVGCGRCGRCQTTVPVHGSRDLTPGTLRSIEAALARCLGEGWLRGRKH